MDLAYVLGDLVELSTKAAKTRKKIHVASFVVLVMGLVGWSGYEVYRCVQSYQHSAWVTDVEFPLQLEFPSVFICATVVKPEDFISSSCTYTQLDNNLDTSPSSQPCKNDNPFIVNRGRYRNYACLPFNIDNETPPYSRKNSEDSLELQVSVALPRNERYSVILVKPGANAETIENTPPLFIGETQQIYYALLSMSTQQFRHQEDSDIWSAVVSAFNTPPLDDLNRTGFPLTTKQIQLRLGYSSWTQQIYREEVAFNWIELLSTIGGAMALLTALQTIFVAASNAITTTTCCRRYCSCLIEKDSDDVQKKQKKAIDISESAEDVTLLDDFTDT